MARPQCTITIAADASCAARPPQRREGRTTTASWQGWPQTLPTRITGRRTATVPDAAVPPAWRHTGRCTSPRGARGATAACGCVLRSCGKGAIKRATRFREAACRKTYDTRRRGEPCKPTNSEDHRCAAQGQPREGHEGEDRAPCVPGARRLRRADVRRGRQRSDRREDSRAAPRHGRPRLGKGKDRGSSFEGGRA